MLKLPAGQRVFPPETVRVRQVLDGNRFWRPAADAEVLFLGDSFANIYSLEPMGWGEAAGFVEHLSLALGLPVDAICRNDAGSHATREMLAKELQRGQDRLAGKKLVIWEFAARELASGDWKQLPMTLGEKRDAGMYVPAAGKTVEIRGVVRAASPAPRPGSVPYKDHIVMVHLAEIESTDDPAAAGKEAVVFVWSMRDNVATAASRYRPGDAVRLRLRPWADVAEKYEAINRSELEDDEILLAEPAWGGIAFHDSHFHSSRSNNKKKPMCNHTIIRSTGILIALALCLFASIASAEKDAATAFREACAQKAVSAGDAMTITGTDGWLFLANELRHVGVGRFWGDARGGGQPGHETPGRRSPACHPGLQAPTRRARHRVDPGARSAQGDHLSGQACRHGGGSRRTARLRRGSMPSIRSSTSCCARRA